MDAHDARFLGLSAHVYKQVQLAAAVALAGCIVLGIGTYRDPDPLEPWFSVAVFVGLGMIGMIFIAGLMMAFAKLAAKRGR